MFDGTIRLLPIVLRNRLGASQGALREQGEGSGSDES
jgi:hypothetical protein